MVNDVNSIDSPPGECATVASGRAPSTGLAPIAETAWLAQATRLRGQAFRYAQNRIAEDLAVAGRPGQNTDPDNAASTLEFDGTPTAAYLVENEKMADLMRDLARKPLATPRK